MCNIKLHSLILLLFDPQRGSNKAYCGPRAQEPGGHWPEEPGGKSWVKALDEQRDISSATSGFNCKLVFDHIFGHG